jgi:hypothetical protein
MNASTGRARPAPGDRNFRQEFSTAGALHIRDEPAGASRRTRADDCYPEVSMSTATAKGPASFPRIDAQVLDRILQEGYGPGAWHGPDLKAAIADVSEDEAMWRPSPDRHNIAEIAIHHAFCAHVMRARLVEHGIEPFALDGDDWFPVTSGYGLDWPRILELVETEQARLAEAVAQSVAKGAAPLTDRERLEAVLGITCHAVYHAGQVQLLKKLRAEQARL